MIESITIRNYRCFKEVRAEDFGAVNVIVGDNRSGKTALLEAIFMVLGNSGQNHIKLRAWRGLATEKVLGAEVESGLLWRDMFHAFKTDTPVQISVRGTNKNENRGLTITMRERAQSVAVDPEAEIKAPIVLTWKDAAGKSRDSIPRLLRGVIEFPSVPSAAIKGAMLTGNVGGAGDTAARFSELDISNRAAPVVDAMRSEFPELEDLSVQVDSSRESMLYATVSGMDQKIPLPLLSTGVNRLVGILLAIQFFRGGAVMIDEIENGFYHTRLEKIWLIIRDIALRNSTQIFVTTHSAEALQALIPAISGHENEFRLIRLTKEGVSSQLKVFPGRGLASALAEHVEVR